MPASVAIVFGLTGATAVGVIVMLTGLVQVVVARRRDAAVRAPLIAAGVGVVITLAAAVTLGTDAALHLTYTYQTFTATN